MAKVVYKKGSTTSSLLLFLLPQCATHKMGPIQNKKISIHPTNMQEPGRENERVKETNIFYCLWVAQLFMGSFYYRLPYE